MKFIILGVFPASLHSLSALDVVLSEAVMFVLNYGLTGRNSEVGLIIPGKPLVRGFENS